MFNSIQFKKMSDAGGNARNKVSWSRTSTSSFGAVMATFNRIIFFFFGVYVLVLFSFSSALWIMERKRQMNDLLERRTI